MKNHYILPNLGLYVPYAKVHMWFIGLVFMRCVLSVFFLHYVQFVRLLYLVSYSISFGMRFRTEGKVITRNFCGNELPRNFNSHTHTNTFIRQKEEEKQNYLKCVRVRSEANNGEIIQVYTIQSMSRFTSYYGKCMSMSTVLREISRMQWSTKSFSYD